VLDGLGCARIVSAGDVAGYGCMINECIAALRARDVINVLGNHDHYLVSGTECPRSRTANRCLRVQRQRVTAENLDWLRASPGLLEFDGISVVHGGWRDPLDEYLYDVRPSDFQDRQESFFVSGHTHIPLRRPFAGKCYCNPGSVGQPRDGDPRAAFAVLDKGVFSVTRVGYDVDAMAHVIRSAGLGERLIESLRQGARIGAPRADARLPAKAPAAGAEPE
jgi:diadenosine tetraphosphatase ApaH/serine/threonine PP2A family protein phosphatase